ncbi:hypothetical protein AAFF_G00382500 [Aldrovandia affinis]|uniref:Uncharacterized protein n=1 Tax=Aldrovandia affinis TaxID=143900 RepID=A0AAD7T8P9_9TELE|nr:hypothetical protein AAFF_G00382500 [Aldrovandia affinis]
MCKLQVDHPDVYKRFGEGFHVVRRSDRVWAGLSVDLVIEPVLMRSMKTSGGLTRGRGMTELQRLKWLLSMPACAEVNNAMQELTGVNHNTGDQNKDMTDARQARDMKDTLTVLNYLQERHPFCSDPSLRSISTGVHAHPSVNVDKAKAVGNTILVSMDGQTTAEYTSKKRDQAITMSTKSSVKIDGEAVQMDLQLLFQQLTIAAKASQDLASVVKYELCSHPSALFDISLLLRQPQKPVLADAIWALHTPDLLGVTGHVQYVLDGGALVQRIPWTRGSTRTSASCTANLLILLIYHANLKSHNLFFTPEPKKSTKKPRVWNIKAVKQQLGPTAAKYHSLRVYYQVQQWKGTVDELLPQEWGWKESDGGLSLSRLTYHQLHWNSYGSSDAPARQTAAA